MEIKVDFTEVELLEQKLSQIGEGSEKIVNEIVHNMGVDTVTRDVTALLPVSSRNKRHAKFSKPFTYEPMNLGFIFKTRGGAAKNKTSFGYLIFPDEGRGPRNPREQDFTGRGIEQAKPKIIDELREVITRKIQEGI